MHALRAPPTELPALKQRPTLDDQSHAEAGYAFGAIRQGSHQAAPPAGDAWIFLMASATMAAMSLSSATRLIDARRSNEPAPSIDR
jgi:hypothetical protein